MSAKVTFFPVGNGDMTLIETENGKKYSSTVIFAPMMIILMSRQCYVIALSETIRTDYS